MLTIEMLPADEGDALWIEYGSDPKRHILIDCGRKTAYREIIKRFENDANLNLELFVMTHVDADHISGAVPLLQDDRFGATRVKDIWFNGWRHLNGMHKKSDRETPGTLSAKQGEYFGALLWDRGYPWNESFDGYAVVIDDDAPLPKIELAGGMTLTLLAPDHDKLVEMRQRWEDDLQTNDPNKHLDPGDFERALELLGRDSRNRPDVLGRGHEGPVVVSELLNIPFLADTSEPNGSSIAFLAEYDDQAILFAGDAHAPQLESSLNRLLADRGKDILKLDALKMSHHGSARNNSSTLLEMIDCQRYLISTNGSRHHHPDPAALARVLDLYDDGVKFYFNYRSEETKLWDDNQLINRHRYKAIYPDRKGYLKLEL
ncbi:MAG: MBL fold metallo-hydrolase [Candidatus Thiodiazotropha sp.]